MAVIYALFNVRLDNVRKIFVHKKYSNHHRRNGHYFSANGPFLLLPLALKWGLFLVGVTFILPCLNSQGANAASLKLIVPSNLSVNITPTAEGNFVESTTSNIGVEATADFGYTLTVQAKDGKTNVLTNSATNTKIESIPSPLTVAQGNTNAWKVNTWGYKTDGDYKPGPTSSSVIANVTTAQADETTNHPFQIAAKVDNTLPAGTYSNTFVFTATANAAKYSITYNNCVDKTTINCPTNIASTSSTEKIITLENKTPDRIGYSFEGWCSQQTENETCEGITYQPDNPYILTASVNTLNLYAIWERDSKFLGDLGNMQEFKCSEKISEQEYYGYATDIRDNNIYTVAKLKDNQCWMTRNLAIGSNEKPIELTSNDSDFEGKEFFVLPQGTQVIAESPDDTSGWSYDHPYETFIYIDAKYGGYYTWRAATADEGVENMTATAQQSICPKGWRLPTSTDIDAITKVYDWQTGLQSPANFDLPGYCGPNGCPSIQGVRGHWWTSNPAGSVAIHDMRFDEASGLYPSAGSRGRGISVRCVSRQ